ncbi:unnamed protein product, partial [Meganyctiphanes norvegica]
CEYFNYNSSSLITVSCPNTATMKVIAALSVLCCMVNYAQAMILDVDSSLNTIDEYKARFLTVDDNGNLALKFNSTSLIYIALFAIPVVIIALLVLPLFGVDLTNIFRRRESTDQDYYAYDNQDYSTYTEFAQRSLELLTPVISAIDDAYQKYQ